MTRAQFDASTGPDGALVVGAPETVAAKIVDVVTTLGLARFDLKYSNGTLPHSMMMRSIELYATKVVPLVMKSLATATDGVRTSGA